MKRFVFWAVVLFVLVLAAPAQVLEKVIYLPDTLAGLVNANRVAVVPGSGAVFVAGGKEGEIYGDCIVVFDGLSGEKRARITIPGGGVRLCYPEGESSLYCASGLFDTVYVVDVFNLRLVTGVGVGAPVSYFCFSPLRRRVYGAGPQRGDVVVIDCAENRVVASVPLGERTGPLVYTCRSDRVYAFARAGGSGRIVVIDCGTNSVVDSVLLNATDISLLLYNSVAHKLYCVDGENGGVTIIDCWTNTVLREWALPETISSLCLHLERNKVYLGLLSEPMVLVISGESDSIIKTISTENAPTALAYDANRDRVYVLDLATPLSVVDCATDSVVAVLRYTGSGESLYFSSQLDRIYTIQGDHRYNDVAIIDPVLLAITGRVPLHFQVTSATYGEFPVRLYCAGVLGGEETGAVITVDGSNNTVCSRLSLPGIPRALFYSPSSNKLYVGCDSVVAVVDCVSESLIKSISVPDPSRLSFYNPVANKIYIEPLGRAIMVLACSGDSLQATIALPPLGSRADAFGFNPLRNKVYIAKMDTLWIVDGAGDTVLGRLPVNAGSVWSYISSRDWVVWGNNRTLRAVGGQSNLLDTVVMLSHIIDGITYNPGTDKLYITCEAAGMIYIYRGSNLRGVGYCAVPATPVALTFSPVDNLIYCRHRDGAITVIDGVTDSVIGTGSAGFSEWSPVLNPTYHRFYAPDAGARGIAVFRTPIPGIGETVGKGRVPDGWLQPTVVNRWFVLPTGAAHGNRGWLLFDITGRRIAELLPGSNDLRHFAPGVYFLRNRDGATGKVVIQH